MPMERLSFLPLLNTPRLPIIPPTGKEVHGNTLDYHTIVASAIYCKVSNAFLKASHHSSRHSPSPNMNHPTSGFCSVSSWGTEGSSAWLIFNSTTAVLFFADPPTPVVTESLMPTLILWRALQHQARCTGRTALSWNEPQSKAVFTGTKLWGQNPEGELGSTAPAPAVTCPKVTRRATSFQGFLLASGSWGPGCCCTVCSRHTVTPQGTFLRTNSRKTWQNHKLIISPAGGEEAWL